MRHLRYDPIHKLWVIFAPKRGGRPTDYINPPNPERTGECPFCPGSEDHTPPEIWALRPNESEPNTPGWSIRIFPNKYPALSMEGVNPMDFPDDNRMMKGVGEHEVIIETPNHETDIPRMEVSQIERIIRAYRSRMAELEKDPRLRYVLIFRNFGYYAGCTFSHPHTQLIATPVIPSTVQTEIDSAREHHRRTGKCWFCETGEGEIKDGSRLIASDGVFAAYAPFASRMPFEICIAPIKHSPMFSGITNDEIVSLAALLKSVLRKLTEGLHGVGYNLFIHTAPRQSEDDTIAPADKFEDKAERLVMSPYEDFYHWHIEILPRLSRVAGFEIGAGFFINTVLPEKAAGALREGRLDEILGDYLKRLK